MMGSTGLQLKTTGYDTVKTPMGLFESENIDNDLNQVDNAIKEYYGIQENTQ